MRKQLKSLSNNVLVKDVKGYIKNTHEFYGARNPEIKTLANRLKEEYGLKEFYRVFNRLWKSGYHNERTLAIYTLALYKDDFDLKTWDFLVPRIREIRDFDEATSVGKIVGEITIKNPKLKKEMQRVLKKKNAYYRRLVLASLFPLIGKKDFDFILPIIKNNLNDKEEGIREINGLLLKKISKKNKTIVRSFILKNKDMDELTFKIATKNLKDMRKTRKLKSLNQKRDRGFSWLRNI